MGRKKGKTFKQGAKVEVYGSDDERTYKRESVPDKNSSEFFEDDIDAFHTERDKVLLRKSAGIREDSSEDEEEAEALGEDDEKEYYLSDDDLQRLERVVETAKSQRWRDRLKQDMQDFGHDEQEGDEEEGGATWGERRKYYSTERDDDRFDAEAAEQEGEEAKRLMEKQLAEFSEDDFLDPSHLIPKATSTDDPGKQESVKRDLSQLPLSEKVKLLRRESPEIFGLYEEYKTSRAELEKTVEPVLSLVAAAKLPDGPAAEVLRARRKALILYCCNLVFYFVLKTARTPLLDHPVIARILQFKRLVEGFRATGKEVDVIARCAEKGGNISRTLRSLRKGKKTKAKPATSEKPPKKTRFMEEDEDEKNEKEPGEEVDLKENGENGDEKRPIDYEMEKNKGLTPKRKKEQRNPRVKHREKFRKAKIRRKGQVREVRAPLNAYGGELSGIRAGIIRSTKFKY